MADKSHSHFFREWREHRGLKQAELAERTDTTEATISRLESGKMPYNQKWLERLAEALDTDPASLIGHNPTEGADIIDLWARLDERGRRTTAAIAEQQLSYRANDKNGR